MRLLLALLAIIPSAALAQDAVPPAQTDPTIWYAIASVAMVLSFALMHWLVMVRR